MTSPNPRLDEHMKVEVVTEENIDNYSIEDVVMPLFGKSVRLPPNKDLKALYDQYLDKDGITIAMFESKAMEGGCSHGAYRHIGMQTEYLIFIVARAKDIQWDTVDFNDKDEDLLNPYYITDGKELEVKFDETKEEKHRALRIKFSLPSSTYATIFVRELTHQKC